MPTRPIRLVAPLDMDDAIRRYLAGEGGLLKIASSLGISNSALKTELRRHGLAPRTQGDAAKNRHVRDAGTEWSENFRAAARRNRERWQATPEFTEASSRGRERAWGANRGSKHTEKHKAARARTHERLRLKVSPYALTLNGWLRDRGIPTAMEFAVGRYNVDIASFPVAVEVHAYSFNPLGSTRWRERQRTRYLCDRGWLVIYVWISARAFVLNEASADYVVSLVEEAKRDPSLVGEYRVIRGTGEFVSAGRPDGDEWA